MLEQLLANPYAGDGTGHPDMHLIYVDQICGLFKLAGLLEDEVNYEESFPFIFDGKKHWHGIGYAMILDLGTGTI